MKKKTALTALIAVFILVGLFVLPAQAVEKSYVSSGVITATAQVYTGIADFAGVIVVPDGSNAATIICYDGKSVAGRGLFPTITIPGTQTTGGGLTFENAITCDVGIYCVLTGTGAKYTVYRSRR